jgi:nucleoside-diphosphate-sugar epimerase
MNQVYHVLITGATGFIGRRLVRVVMEQNGVAMSAVSRTGGRCDGLIVDALDLSSDVDIDRWAEGKPRFDSIFHLAAEIPSSTSEDLEALFIRNMAMTANVLRLARRNMSTIIYASSAYIYDGHATERPFVEESRPLARTYYHLSKLAGELLLQTGSRRHGVPVACLRIASPFGPGQPARGVLRAFLSQAREGKDLILSGSGERRQDFVHVDDVSQAMWLAFIQGATGVFNVASGRSVSMKELAAIIVAALPGTGSRIKWSGDTDPLDAERWVFSIERARRELGFNPRFDLQRELSSLPPESVG